MDGSSVLRDPGSDGASPRPGDGRAAWRRPIRVGMLFDGGAAAYGVYGVARGLLSHLDRTRARVVGLFLGAGDERRELGPLCDEVHDLKSGHLLPLAHPKHGRYHLPTLVSKVVVFTRAVAALHSAIRSCDLDLVHVHFFPLHYMAGLACRSAGARCVWHWHGAWQPGRRDMRIACNAMRVFADRVACISGFVRDSLPESVRSRARLVYNGVDCEEIVRDQRRGALREMLGVSGDCPLVAIAGSLTPYKGHQYFIDAAPRVLQQYPEARFVVIGGVTKTQKRFGLEARWRKLAQDRGVGDKVLFTGFVDGAARLLGDVDIVCTPTIPLGIAGEGFGLVVAEAMAAGAATISSDLGGPREIIEHGHSGLLVPHSNAEALADAIIELLRDPARRRAIAAAGQERVRTHFDIRHSAGAMADVYEDCLADDHGLR